MDGQVGIWMELVQGRTLQEMIETQGVFGAEEAKAVGREVCQALASVHAAGLLHRDIKARNVMRAEGGRFLLMDFGVGAEVREEAAVRARSGTPTYMAPETAREGISTVASDIYSVGVLLFHLLTGRYPGDPVPAQATVRLARKPATRRHDRAKRGPDPSARIEDYRADLPADLVAVIETAMDPDPARRFRTAGAMLHALDPAARLERGMGAAALAALAKINDNLGRRLDPVDRASRNRQPLMERAVDTVLRLLMVLMGLWVAAWILRQIFRQVFGY